MLVFINFEKDTTVQSVIEYLLHAYRPNTNYSVRGPGLGKFAEYRERFYELSWVLELFSAMLQPAMCMMMTEPTDFSCVVSIRIVWIDSFFSQIGVLRSFSSRYLAFHVFVIQSFAYALLFLVSLVRTAAIIENRRGKVSSAGR